MSAPPNDGDAGSSSKPKAISSFAKRPSDTTRQGTQKLKFAPTLPPRRKKDEVKEETKPQSVPSTPSRDRGRGRGDGHGRGRGAARPAVEMTASGPFAMGPSMGGGAARRILPRSSFAIPNPVSTPGSSGPSSLSNTPAPSIKKEDKGKGKAENEDDDEVYSDPDEGVQIVDMVNVKQMDWMAPESLKRERQKKVKKEEATEEGVDTSQALNLSESEDEEELEDIIEDFAANVAQDQDADPTLRQDRLYFFQFPAPFPTYTQKGAATAAVSTERIEKKVTFVESVKPEDHPVPEASQKVTDGTIGRLEVYKSGAVKICLANGIVLDVTAATQPSFLQQAVAVDLKDKKLAVLGEVNRRFVASPDVDSLLAAMDQAELKPSTIEGEEELLSMDTS